MILRSTQRRYLGTLSGPTLLFGGPYSNLEATWAVLAEAPRRRITPDRIICTGDMGVAYGADPKATVDLIRGFGIHAVAGDCEEALAARASIVDAALRPGARATVFERRHIVDRLEQEPPRKFAKPMFDDGQHLLRRLDDGWEGGSLAARPASVQSRSHADGRARHEGRGRLRHRGRWRARSRRCRAPAVRLYCRWRRVGGGREGPAAR